MKTVAARRSELAIHTVEVELARSVEVLERLPEAQVSESLRRSIEATASVQSEPVATLPIHASSDEVVAWIERLIAQHFPEETLWIGTAIQGFPLLRIKPKTNEWIRSLLNSFGELDQVLVSEDLTHVGRLSTEETRHEFLVAD